MKKSIYVCYDHGEHSIKQVVQLDGIIWIDTKSECDPKKTFHEEFQYNPASGCIESYKCHRNHLLIDKFEYTPGEVFMPNIRARQYKGYSAENAYCFYQAILLLPKINKNSQILLYDHKNFSFSALLFKETNIGITNNNDNYIFYKIVSPIVAIAEYEKESNLLRLFQSRDLCLNLTDNM